jgi:hypothetical protein
MANDIDQEQFRDDQNFDVDINKVYQNFIIEIDKIRSHFNVQSNSVDIQFIDSLTYNQTVEKNPQESRCHAFYRLIGLPIISTDGKALYCPGHDSPNNSDQELINSKIQIAKKISKDMFKLLDARENLPRDFASTFSLQSVTASALAMSLAEIRPFDTPLKVEEAFDIKKKSQSYTNKLAGRLSKTVQDYSFGETANLSSERLHILKPFIVDPRIDLMVNPNMFRLSVPFVADKSELKFTDNSYLKRPYIEKVCRERFSVYTDPDLLIVGDHTKSIINNIKNNESIKDQELVKLVFNTDLITSEEIQFANYINIIRSMLKKLSDAVDEVHLVLASDPEASSQAKYNWIPIPDKRGPEFGSQTQDVMNQQQDPNNTLWDSELISLLYRQEITSVNNKLREINKSDLGGFAFDNVEITPDSNSSDAYGDGVLKACNELKQQRKYLTDKANQSIRHIEIIMGEFSGLGLCDILAISAAFWVVDKKVLVNMLDDTALARMNKDPSLKGQEILDRQNGYTMLPIEAISEFETKVKQIFELMNVMYTDIRSKNKR